MADDPSTTDYGAMGEHHIHLRPRRGPSSPFLRVRGADNAPPWMPRTVANLLQIMRRLFARPRAHADATPAPTVRDDLAKDSCTPTDMHTYGQDA